jgi:hypothetical protein
VSGLHADQQNRLLPMFNYDASKYANDNGNGNS